MRQQINLYQPIFSEARAPLSFTLAAIVLGLVLAALTTYSMIENSKLRALTAEVEALRIEQSEQDALLTATSEQQAAREKPVAIEARIKVLERAIADRTAALKVLQSGAAGQTNGFADRMAALARRHVDGLWIDKLLLSGTNGSMSLSGATLDADNVPAYLRSLASEKVLSGTRFDDFIIENPKSSTTKAEAVETNDEGEIKSPKAVSPTFIRFRAGSKSLHAPVGPEEAAT